MQTVSLAFWPRTFHLKFASRRYHATNSLQLRQNITVPPSTLIALPFILALRPTPTTEPLMRLLQA